MDKKRKVENITQGNSKDFLQDGMTNDEIRASIKYIRAYIEKKGSATLSERVDELTKSQSIFAERYPILFDMCTRPQFNFDDLNYFLQKRDEIINDKISVEDASKEIGKEWFNKYVDTSKLPTK